MQPPASAPERRRRQIVTDAYCPGCAYNLRGVEVDDSDVCVCPECAAHTTAYYLLEQPPKRGINTAQWSVAATIAALAVFVVGYRLLALGNLRQTAALFIGLPAALAIIITLAPRASSATGMAIKGTTIALLVSGIALGEGLICVLMMAPIFYTVAIIVGLTVDFVRKSRGRVSGIKLRCALAVPLLLLSLEGVDPRFSFPRHATVERSAVVDAAPGSVAASLAATPRFDEPLPLYLSLGFPRPTRCRGAGLEVGDERIIHFDALGAGDGDLRLRVVERGPGLVVFAPVADTSKIAGWLRWQRIEVRWTAVAPQRTAVTWRIRYERRLDPAWYFAPWQRYAVGLAAEHLIETVATPDRGAS